MTENSVQSIQENNQIKFKMMKKYKLLSSDSDTDEENDINYLDKSSSIH